jgi:hypothetical protein
VPDPLWLEGEANRELIPLIVLVGTCAIVVVITAPGRIATSTNLHTKFLIGLRFLLELNFGVVAAHGLRRSLTCRTNDVQVSQPITLAGRPLAANFRFRGGRTERRLKWFE